MQFRVIVFAMAVSTLADTTAAVERNALTHGVMTDENNQAYRMGHSDHGKHRRRSARRRDAIRMDPNGSIMWLDRYGHPIRRRAQPIRRVGADVKATENDDARAGKAANHQAATHAPWFEISPIQTADRVVGVRDVIRY
ncbi:hypothetical protein [Burkholderia ubonensis]|uniref:hypothetical protein n=1 Tax=Burkholderia ubonensis TaxID=101571 RepID=UPI0012FBE6BB|nr:hypothetical protein [Burkholderia ubonensis]